MKTMADIFGENALTFDLDDNYAQVELNIFDGENGSLLEIAIQNIDDTPGLGDGYAKRNPVLLAGILQTMIIDHNSRHLIHTLQTGVTELVNTMQKAQAANFQELQWIRQSIEKLETLKWK